MTKRKNPFSKETKKEERNAKREKKIADLRKVVAIKHKEALAAEKAIETHERNIAKTAKDNAIEERTVAGYWKRAEVMRRKLEAYEAKLTRRTERLGKNALKLERMRKATAGKQKACNGKFRHFNSAEDQLAKLTGYKLPKGM